MVGESREWDGKVGEVDPDRSLAKVEEVEVVNEDLECARA
jgi:hypothetical protein